MTTDVSARGDVMLLMMTAACLLAIVLIEIFVTCT